MSNAPQDLTYVTSHIPAHQKASQVQRLDQAISKKHGVDVPVYVTTEVQKDPALDQALTTIGRVQGVQVGETIDVGHGLQAFFGFAPELPNGQAFFVLVFKHTA
ncbi:hypothetical protein [Burkholderia glumae]|uniref:hypothetical protein n=1 Tax=Burkholderia glumae TaxID=337 RepID=UPI00215051A4|nr:hypothetical protein [Burkholderia glumae]